MKEGRFQMVKAEGVNELVTKVNVHLEAGARLVGQPIHCPTCTLLWFQAVLYPAQVEG